MTPSQDAELIARQLRQRVLALRSLKPTKLRLHDAALDEQAADRLEALSKENERLRALISELVDRDVSYQGESIVIPCAGHGNAIALVRRCRAALEQTNAGER